MCFYKETWGIFLCKIKNRRSFGNRKILIFSSCTSCFQIGGGMSFYRERWGIFLCKITNRRSFGNRKRLIFSPCTSYCQIGGGMSFTKKHGVYFFVKSQTADHLATGRALFTVHARLDFK